ncbi:MAG: threonine synthase [Alphaproteobacteria bacterium]|nr:threonine synthase [Alphaproteobacteria bacterium]
MNFISTRGQAPRATFSEALLSGLAPDGGLYMPDAWPRVDVAGGSYRDAAFAVLRAFADFDDAALKADIASAYATFDDPHIAPLAEIGEGRYLLELFHGPTLAFKDIAMQLLGRLFARALAQRGGRATVLAATSGDTGSAAIAALGGLPDIELFVLHPKGRVSEVQRRQMTTSTHANIHNIALEGSFDDAQAIVKALFADEAFARKTQLTAVNSINFARIAAQSVYYFTATAALGRAATFVVPTGNFGDVFAGEAAMRMGLDVERLVVATNANDIVARALNDGLYEAGRAEQTLSPSMDIQVASNFERALFEASGRDDAFVRDAMAERRLVLPAAVRTALAARYEAHAVGDAQTLATLAQVHKATGRLIDPHTAVAVAAAERIGERGAGRTAGPSAHQKTGPVVILSTAHPAKFPDAVARATGQIPPLPPGLSGLHQKRENFTVLSPDLGLVRSFIAARVPAS